MRPAAPLRSRSPSASPPPPYTAAPQRPGRPRPGRSHHCATCATIPPVNPLDLVAIVLVVLAVLLGFRSGALPQVGGLLGAIGGGAIVVLSLPLLVEPLTTSRPACGRMSCSTGLLLAVGIGESLGSTIGRAIARALGRGPGRGRSRRGRVHRRRPGTPHRVAGRRPPGDRADPAPDRGRPDLDGDPDAQRRAATTRRDRDGARVAPGRLRPARGLRRPGAPAPAPRRPTHGRDGPGDRRARRGEHGAGLGRDVRIRVVGERRRGRDRLRGHERARRRGRRSRGRARHRHRRAGGRQRRPVRSGARRRGPARAGPAGRAPSVRRRPTRIVARSAPRWAIPAVAASRSCRPP